MAKQKSDYKRYDDYKERYSYTPWYKNIIFVTEITGAIWAVIVFVNELFKKLSRKNKNESFKLSIADGIRYVSSGLLPGISYNRENYKNIPLPVAIFVCIISPAALAGIVFVAIVVLSSNY